MITGYIQVNLQDMLEELGKDKTQEILMGFENPLNYDVEEFLRYKAVEFSKQSLSRTFLVFASFRKRPVLVGYYTLANKFIHIEKKSLSKTLRKRMSRFAQFDSNVGKFSLSALLIAQLGKNYANGNNSLITGDELLKLACDRVRDIQYIIGGKVVYLECEDIDKLKNFYKENGFIDFGKRDLDIDEKGKFTGAYLIQMLRYL